MAGRNTSSPLGVGVVWVPGLEPLLEPGMGLVDVVEIEPQQYWDFHPDAARPYRMQEAVLSYLNALDQPLIVHGVGGAAGGTVAPNAEFTRTFLELVADLKPAWVSEHLSFLNVANPDVAGTDAGYFAGMMLPPLQTRAGVETAVRSLREATRGLAAPFALETQVNYMQSRCGNLGDGEFLSQVAQQLDCGILLDLANILVNEKNGRQPVEEYLDSIPLDRVWEVHLAGSRLDDGVWLDAHNGTMTDELLELTERVLPRLPNVKALILEVIPYFVPRAGMDLLGRQLELMRNLWNSRASARTDLRATTPPPSALRTLQGAEHISPAIWEKTLGEWTALGRGGTALYGQLQDDRGMRTYRMVANSFRSGNLSDTMGLTVQFLLKLKGAAFVENLLEEYCRWCPPAQFPVDEAKAFTAYLRAHPIEHPYLANILDFDEAKLLALEANQPREIHFDYEPNRLLESVAKGEVPENLRQGNFLVEVTP